MNEFSLPKSDDNESPKSLTDALQAQIVFYQKEYENLSLETKSLIEENNRLNKQLKESFHVQSENDNAELLAIHRKYEEAAKNLENKLGLCEKEKNSYQELWKTSQNAIRSLEEELRTYQIYQNSTAVFEDVNQIKQEYSSAINLLESKISELQSHLRSNEEALKTLNDTNNNLQKALNESHLDQNEAKSKESELLITINTLEKDLGIAKRESTSYKQNCEELLKSMDVCRQEIEVYMKKDAESRNKVVEALRLVDAAVLERDLALEREKNANEEAVRLSSQVSDVLHESAQRIQKEIDLAKQGYNEKLNDMLIHVQRLELEVGEKNLALERALRDCKMLEDEIERHRKDGHRDDSTDCKVLLLEQKLEATFQQLILSERRNIQIISENESLRMDFDQLVNGFKRDKRRDEWEEKLRIHQTESLKKQIGSLKDSLNEAHRTIQSLKSNLAAKEQLQMTLFDEKENAFQEFQRHFETQQKLNTKWKQSMKELTTKLETRLEELKISNKRLIKDNAKLRIQCGERQEPNISNLG